MRTFTLVSFAAKGEGFSCGALRFIQHTCGTILHTVQLFLLRSVGRVCYNGKQGNTAMAKSKGTTLHVRLRPDLKAELRKAAARCGMSESNWVRLKMTEILGTKPELAFPPNISLKK